MKTLVIDACVAIKWFIPEVHAIKAAGLLSENIRLLAPDLIFAEVGNILWKKQRLKEIAQDIAYAILNDFKRLPIESYEIEPLLEEAWQIATLYQCTVYDGLYVALAKRKKCMLVTADQKLVNLLKATPIAKSLLWIEDVKI